MNRNENDHSKNMILVYNLIDDIKKDQEASNVTNTIDSDYLN